MDYMKTFLSTYHSFTTTPILVQKLIARYYISFTFFLVFPLFIFLNLKSLVKRYHVPPSVKLSDAQIKVVRLRVINAFKVRLTLVDRCSFHYLHLSL